MEQLKEARAVRNRKEPIFGIIAIPFIVITLFAVSFFYMLGIVFSVVIIALCAIALIRNEKLLAFPITGILLGLFFLGCCLFLVLGGGADQPVKDNFAGRVLTMEDESTLYLYEDGTYCWYKDKKAKTDNYFTGTFKTYSGEDAMNYLTVDLAKYNVTEHALNSYYERNSDSQLYTKDNLCCLVMNCNYRIVDGEEKKDLEEVVPYLGFVDGNTYDLANMNTEEYLTITDVEHISGEK